MPAPRKRGAKRRRTGPLASLRASFRRLSRETPPEVPPPVGPSSGFGVETLHRVTFERSDVDAYRLNLVVPTVEATRTFGGIRTAVDLFEAIATPTEDRRIIAAGGAGSGATDAIRAYATDGEDVAAPRRLVLLGTPDARLTIRARDVFIATFWTTAELVARIRDWQAATYGWAPELFGYVIQDYEPGFYPMSVNSLFARATYDRPDETVGIFNASTLRDYLHASGIRFRDEHTFEPRILPELRAAMSPPAEPRTRTIVVYGRPNTPRNAFPAIVDGLRAWRAQDPGSDAWSVVSVGQAHPVIDLGRGMTLRSAGKLGLDAYTTLLRTSAIGVSLMVSPHPSYPPLEMAHSGMLVLTNRFATKDLSTWHTNVRSVDSLSSDVLAAALASLCRAFEADPALGSTGVPIRDDFVSEAPQFPFADELAARLRAAARSDPIDAAPPA